MSLKDRLAAFERTIQTGRILRNVLGGKQVVAFAKLDIGETSEGAHLRFQRFREHINIIDTEYAGKKGKTCDLAIVRGKGYNGKIADALEALSKVIASFHAISEIEQFVKDEFDDILEVEIQKVKSFNVLPRGIRPIKMIVDDGNLDIKSDPNEFLVRSRAWITPPKKGPGGAANTNEDGWANDNDTPAFAQDTLYWSEDKPGAKIFNAWLVANPDEAKQLTIEKLRLLWNTLRVKYDYK